MAKRIQRRKLTDAQVNRKLAKNAHKHLVALRCLLKHCQELAATSLDSGYALTYVDGAEVLIREAVAVQENEYEGWRTRKSVP